MARTESGYRTMNILESLWYWLGDYLCRHDKHHWNYKYCSRCGMDVYDFVAKNIRRYESDCEFMKGGIDEE